LRTVMLSAAVRVARRRGGGQHAVELGDLEPGSPIIGKFTFAPGPHVLGPALVVVGGVDRWADDLHATLVELGLRRHPAPGGTPA
jgi:hypothetical protein